jgi:hypothetical protein
MRKWQQYQSKSNQAARHYFKREKLEAILTFISGKDVFVTFPTGYGKSIIYGKLPLIFDQHKGKHISVQTHFVTSTSCTHPQSRREKHSYLCKSIDGLDKQICGTKEKTI